MTPRDFIVTPSAWLTDPNLNRLSDDAEILFRRLASCTDKLWRFSFDPNALEHSVRTAVFSPTRRFRAWNPDRIRRSLNELTAAGMLIRHCQGDRYWLQVADAYRYEKGRDPLGIERSPQQPELPESSPGLFALPPPDPSRTTKAKTLPSVSDSARAGIPRRTESEQSKAKESSREHAPAQLYESYTRHPEGTLAQLRRRGDSDPNRFARDEGTFPDDELWADLCRTLGPIDMHHNGAMWEKRFRENRQAVCHALMDYLTKPPEDRGRIPAAPYITAAFRNETRRTA
ncbi:hypothetical protein ACXR0O_19050 [Verrucomicrobiota bacterium sgz303538]